MSEALPRCEVGTLHAAQVKGGQCQQVRPQLPACLWLQLGAEAHQRVRERQTQAVHLSLAKRAFALTSELAQMLVRFASRQRAAHLLHYLLQLSLQ